MKKNFKMIAKGILLLMLSGTTYVTAQKVYSDGRPATAARLACADEGIVLRYGDGPDSCDTYGIREAVVNKEGDTYYLFYDGAGKEGWVACLAESKDLRSWTKKGPILSLGAPGTNDSKSASSRLSPFFPSRPFQLLCRFVYSIGVKVLVGRRAAASLLAQSGRKFACPQCKSRSTLRR